MLTGFSLSSFRPRPGNPSCKDDGYAGRRLVYAVCASLIAPAHDDGAALTQSDVDRTLRQFLPEATLIELRHDRPLELVAFVQESQAEGEADILEDVGILRPGDHRARAHYRGNVSIHEGVAGEIGHAHHFADDVAAFIRAVVPGLRQHDLY